MPGPLHDGHRPRSRSPLALVSLISLFVIVALTTLALFSRPNLSPSNFLQDHPVRPESGLKRDADLPKGDKYLIGVGKADVTGPVVEINFAGYADPDQVGSGLRQRLYSRAFIVGSVDSPDDRFVYMVLDVVTGDTAIRNGILEGLKALGPEYAVYSTRNVALTGTHSHAGPGGWWNYLLPQVTSMGFNRQGYQAIVDGAVLSIKRAHESLTEVRNRNSSTLISAYAWTKLRILGLP